VSVYPRAGKVDPPLQIQLSVKGSLLIIAGM
jgi:hypothetical protein